ncbi:MAG: orotate phosphoribosyltransferase [Chloroflexi bacterium]|nr:orotate phosphoribosyltransferase [Chloroflexota bacterium]
MSVERRGRILEVAKARGALRYGDFLLSSGQRSPYYFDGRLVSLDPEGAHLLAQEVLALARACGARAIGGPTLGADPIVAAVVLLSHLEGYPMSGFLVRSEAKGHGTQRLTEGPLAPGTPVLIVDDVCTTGGALLHAIAAAEEAGCQAVRVVAVLDRCQGGSESLRKQGYDFEAMLTATPDGEVEVAGGGR